MRTAQDVIDLHKSDPELGTRSIAKQTGYSRRSVRRILSPYRQAQTLQEEVTDLKHEYAETETTEIDLIAEIAKQRKTIQRQSDQLRVLRKENRVSYRYDNAIEAYVAELCSLLKEKIVLPTVIESDEVKRRALEPAEKQSVGILQLSDLHLNELIDLPHNKYDFTVASQRLEKLVMKAIRFFADNGVSTVHIAMTGDFINSDRRLDELLSMATNRTRATMLAVDLIGHVIVQIAAQFNVVVHYVTGNESRVDKELTYTDMAVSDNYDTMIFEMLKRIYNGYLGHVDFIDPNTPDETVIDVNGKNILLTHGGSLPQTSLGNAIQKVKGKYANVGIVVDYVLFGHFHDCSISDFYARSSSLCGGNAYSDSKLNLTGRASQLLHLINDDGIETIKIDLQNVNGYDGFDIDKELAAYNAKSIKKVVRKKTI